MKRVLRWLDALFFPPRCAACGKLMHPDAVTHDLALCPHCKSRFEGEMHSQCPRCFLEYCACRCAPKSLRDRGISCYVKLAPYGGDRESSVTQNLVLGIKKDPSHRAVGFFASELAVGVKAAVEASERMREKHGKAPLETVITYLPRSKKKVRRVGVDQAKELARALSKSTGYCFRQLLVRVHDGASQKSLTKKARTENLKGAFAKKGENVSNFRVLLVDDVVTTGAGMAECAKALSCAELVAVSVAYTEKKRIK